MEWRSLSECVVCCCCCCRLLLPLHDFGQEFARRGKGHSPRSGRHIRGKIIFSRHQNSPAKLLGSPVIVRTERSQIVEATCRVGENTTMEIWPFGGGKLPDVSRLPQNYRIGYVLFLRVLYIGVLQTTYYLQSWYFVAGVRTTIPYFLGLGGAVVRVTSV